MRNSWVCVDANLVIRLVADPRDGVVERLWEQWDGERRQLAAPTLLFYEVTNALYRYQREGLLSASAVRLALRAALSLPVRLFCEPDLYRRAPDLAEGPRLPAAHDAHFLALAEWLGGEFWTVDRRLANAVAGVLPWVHVLVCE